MANRKRILVVDESWMTSLDQRRRKWGPKGQKNTLVQKELGKKVNIIAGLDTDGRVYVALHQTNTNESVFVAFLSRLVDVLRREDP